MQLTIKHEAILYFMKTIVIITHPLNCMQSNVAFTINCGTHSYENFLYIPHVKLCVELEHFIVLNFVLHMRNSEFSHILSHI
jgi:hypothetical protein